MISPPTRTQLIDSLNYPNTTSRVQFTVNIERKNDYNKNARGDSFQSLTQEQAGQFAEILLNGGEIQFTKLFPRFLRSLPSGSVT